MQGYECCGHCRYHLPDLEFPEKKDFTCDCEESEYYTDYTEFNDSCEYWEERSVYIP